MIVKTRIFEFYNGKYKNLSDLAWAMGISVSQIYRVREGKRNINQKFIIGAVKAFPGNKLDDLFYFAPSWPTVTNSPHRQDSAIHPIYEPATKERQRVRENTARIRKVYLSV